MKPIFSGWVLLSAIVFLSEGCTDIQDESPAIRLIGHRGYSGRYAENSEEAVQGLISTGIDRVEIDLVWTGDDSAIVFHDVNSARLTNLTADIVTLTADQVRTGFRTKMNASLLTFRQFADRYGLRFNQIYLDLKSGQDEKVFDLVRQVIRISDETSLTGRIIFTCTEGAPLDTARSISPGIQVALDQNQAGLEETVKKGYPFLLCEKTGLSQTFVTMCNSARVTVVGYTVNSVPEMQQLAGYGVSLMMTDYPELKPD